jgi:hypothetical protein
MPAYAYPIEIVREPKVLSYTKEYDLGYDPSLSIQCLRKKYGIKDEKTLFSIHQEESSKYTLVVSLKKKETKKQMNERIKREENYMKKYHEFQEQKKIKKINGVFYVKKD